MHLISRNLAQSRAISRNLGPSCAISPHRPSLVAEADEHSRNPGEEGLQGKTADMSWTCHGGPALFGGSRARRAACSQYLKSLCLWKLSCAGDMGRYGEIWGDMSLCTAGATAGGRQVDGVCVSTLLSSSLLLLLLLLLLQLLFCCSSYCYCCYHCLLIARRRVPLARLQLDVPAVMAQGRVVSDEGSVG